MDKRFQKRGAIFLSVLLLSGLLYPFGHLALEEHRVCSVHRTIEHVEADREGSLHRSSSSTDRADPLLDSSETTRGPEECPIAIFVRESDVTLAEIRVEIADIPPLDATDTIIRRTHRRAFDPIDALFYAPNTSPPSRSV